MTTVRDDADGLVLQRKTLAPLLMLGMGIPALALFISMSVHRPLETAQWCALTAIQVASMLFCCFFSAFEETFAFSRSSRRILIVRKYTTRTTRQELDYAQVKAVEVRPARHLFQIVFLALDDGRKIGVVVDNSNPIDQRRECEELATRLRDALGLSDPAARLADDAECSEPFELEMAASC